MPGCACGKPIGFSGEHKRGCPLREPDRVPVHSLSELATGIKAIRQEKAVRDALSQGPRTLGNNAAVGGKQRKDAERIIVAMLKELEG